MRLAQADRRRYLKGLTAFVVRQLDSRLRTNFLVMAAVCGILTVTIVAVGLGAGTALAMNRAAQAAVPYDLNVLSDVDQDGDTDNCRLPGAPGAWIWRSMPGRWSRSPCTTPT